jgi:transcriptional regulator GlxA family with amidase domain
VEEYIEANWRRALTIEEIAEETGVGVRSMFLTFKRARGYTPMSFLQRVRLEQARRMLQTPDETTSVTAVGLWCGFHNAGHFARYYRQAFNELPSATLAMAKGARRSTQRDADA